MELLAAMSLSGFILAALIRACYVQALHKVALSESLPHARHPDATDIAAGVSAIGGSANSYVRTHDPLTNEYHTKRVIHM